MGQESRHETMPHMLLLSCPHWCSYSKVTMTAFTVVPSRSGAGERACGGAWCGVVWHSTAQHCMQLSL